MDQEYTLRVWRVMILLMRVMILLMRVMILLMRVMILLMRVMILLMRTKYFGPVSVKADKNIENYDIFNASVLLAVEWLYLEKHNFLSRC